MSVICQLPVRKLDVSEQLVILMHDNYIQFTLDVVDPKILQ